MLPGMDGLEVCRRLKADPVCRDIPVLFLTAKSEPEDEAYGIGLGAADYIHKPVSPSHSAGQGCGTTWRYSSTTT